MIISIHPGRPGYNSVSLDSEAVEMLREKSTELLYRCGKMLPGEEARKLAVEVAKVLGVPETEIVLA